MRGTQRKREWTGTKLWLHQEKKNYSKLHVTTCVSLHVQIRLTNSESRDESKARKTLSTYNDLRFRSRSCWDLVGSENGNRPDSPMKIRPVQEQDGRWSATYSNSPSTIRTPSPYHIPRNFLLVLDFRPTCHHLAMFDGFYASFSVILERVTLLLLSSFQIIDRLFKKFV